VCSSLIDSDGSESRYGKYIKLAVIAGLVVILDQITKILILKNVPLYHSITIIPGFFNITHIHNPGGAFGFMAHQDSSLRKLLFIFLSSSAICVIFYFYINSSKTHPFLASGFALILGGAIGNLIDRIRFGKVVDFLDFYIHNYHWPAFNIADSAITVGVTIFIFHLLFKKMP
jgi:signal peptidase II